MAHAVEMFFDEQADAAVRGMWHVLAGAGLPSLAISTHRPRRPDMTLTVTESSDGADLSRLTSVLRGRHPKLDLVSWPLPRR